MDDPVKFGRYILERRLAVGGMAEVLLARIERAEGFQKRVVLKRILPHLRDDETYVSMFIDEAKLAGLFEHPNLVQVFDLECIDGQYCLSMEYVEGEDVRAILNAARTTNHPLSFGLVAKIICSAAEGLQYAHDLKNERGEPLRVVHRDVSPGNIIVTWPGGVKVVDFGIAKHEAARSKTFGGMVKGKAAYMSPEQAQGKSLDRRSDVFSLGVTFYEMLTLEPCFAGSSTAAILHAVTDGRFDPVEELRPDIPPELKNILNRMLSVDREERFASAEEVHRELVQHLTATHMPSPTDVTTFLADLFKSPSHAIPERVPTTLWDSSEIPVTEHLASPRLPMSKQVLAQPQWLNQRSRSDAATAVLPETVDSDMILPLEGSGPVAVNEPTRRISFPGGKDGGARDPAQRVRSTRRKEPTAVWIGSEDEAVTRTAFRDELSPGPRRPATPQPMDLIVTSHTERSPALPAVGSSDDEGLAPFDIPSDVDRLPRATREGHTVFRHLTAETVRRPVSWPVVVIILVALLGLLNIGAVMAYRAALGLEWRPRALWREVWDQLSPPPPTRHATSGSLEINSEPPGARVWLDGEPAAGTTPLTIGDIAVGRAIRIEVQQTGFRAERRTVVLNRSKTVAVSVTLTPLMDGGVSPSP